MNQPWVFRWLSTRQCIRPLRNIDFFLYTLPPRIRWHNGEYTVGRLSEYRRKMYNCLKFKCRWCCDRPDQPVLMYRVSSCHRVEYIIGRIMDSYIHICTYMCSHATYTHALLLDSKCGELSRYTRGAWTITNRRSRLYLRMSINAASIRIIYL